MLLALIKPLFPFQRNNKNPQLIIKHPFLQICFFFKMKKTKQIKTDMFLGFLTNYHMEWNNIFSAITSRYY